MQTEPCDCPYHQPVDIIGIMISRTQCTVSKTSLFLTLTRWAWNVQHATFPVRLDWIWDVLQLVSTAPDLITATHTSPTTKKVNDLQFLLEQSTACKVTVSTDWGRKHKQCLQFKAAGLIWFMWLWWNVKISTQTCVWCCDTVKRNVIFLTLKL